MTLFVVICSYMYILSLMARSVRISESIEDAFAYTRLTDAIVQEIISSDNVELTEVSFIDIY